jgi:hypothetical protein
MEMAPELHPIHSLAVDFTRVPFTHQQLHWVAKGNIAIRKGPEAWLPALLLTARKLVRRIWGAISVVHALIVSPRVICPLLVILG